MSDTDQTQPLELLPRARPKKAKSVAAGVGGSPVRIHRSPQELKDLPPFRVTGNNRRDRIAQWIMIKSEDPSLRQHEIAKKMGLTPASLSALITKARKDGMLQFDNPFDTIEHKIIPKTVDNLMEFLEAKDKTVTLETAKGTIFKTYAASKGVVEGGSNVLALKIEMPSDPDQTPKLVVGQIVGQPKQID